MKSILRTGLLITAAIMPLGAQAQEGVASQEAQADGFSGLADIVVTATKRNENLQNVPVSVSAITSEQLSAQGVFSTADLNASIPNLQVSSAYGETQPNFTLRGIGVGTEYNSNAASPIGIYVDEVYQSFRASHGQQLYDLDQIEVVRGPQGTLFGRNTTGGAINFITRKPALGGSNGYAKVGYGSFNRISGEGAIELTPVDGVLGFRIAGTFVDSDPYVKNLLPGGTINQTSPNIPDSVAYGDLNSGISPGGHRTWGIRASLRFNPSDALDINLKGYLSDSKGGQDSPQNVGPQLTSDTITLANSALGGLYLTPLAPLLPSAYSRDGRGLSDREIEANSIGNAVIKTKGIVLNVKANLSDTLSLTSISGYDTTRLGLLPRIDCDGTPYDVCSIGYGSKSRSFNQDLRVDYEGDKVKAIVGAYYGYDRIVARNIPDFYGFLSDVRAAIGLPATYFNPGGLVDPTGFPTRLFATQNFTQVRKSYAVYGEASYELTDKVKLTAGLRYTKDKFAYKDALTTFYDDTGAARLYTVSDYAPNGVFQNYLIGVSPGTANPLNRSDSSSAVTGRAIIDWKVAEHVLLYASYSRGYRGGTYNGLAFQTASQVYFVPPEKVDAFEAGIKSRFLDNRMQLNVSVFHYNYKQQQNQLLDPSSVTFLTSLDGKLTGLDAELTFAASNRLRFNAGIGILDSSFAKGNCPTALITGQPPQQGNCVATGAGNIDVGGNPFPYAATFSANLGADWTAFEIGDGKVILHGDASYTGRFYYDFFKNYDFPGGAGGPYKLGEGDYWIANARISYATSRFSIAAFVKNLTDKLYFPNGINTEGSYGSDYIVRAAPRTFGVEASVNF